MNRAPTPADPTRRRLLLGLGAVPLAWALAPLAAAHADDTPGLVAEPQQSGTVECLADLIEQGVVNRADLVAR